MRFDILTLHPAMVEVPLGSSILGRAQAAGRVTISVHDIRDFSTNKHRTVDDTPYGGGAGMVMRVDVVARAIEAVRTEGHTGTFDHAKRYEIDATRGGSASGRFPPCDCLRSL